MDALENVVAAEVPLTDNVVPLNVIFELPNNPVPPVATVKTFPHAVEPMIDTELAAPPEPAGPVGPVTVDAAPVTPWRP